MTRHAQAAQLLRLAGELVNLDAKRREKESKEKSEKHTALIDPFLDNILSNVDLLDDLAPLLKKNAKVVEAMRVYRTASSKLAAQLRSVKEDLEAEAEARGKGTLWSETESVV